MDDPITGTLYMQKHAFKSRPCKVKKDVIPKAKGWREKIIIRLVC